MTGEVLLELATQVRRGTLEILQNTPPSWLAWAPPGTRNPILWHAGHALWLQDALCVQPLTGRSELPAGWADLFGMRSRPEATTSWPPSDQVERLLEDQLARLGELLRQTPDAALQDPDRRAGRWGSLAGLILHGLHDEARHSGEMYLLWKLCRAGIAR